MKKSIVFLLAVMALSIVGCNNNSYNSLRNAEDKLIKNYISRNNLVILTEEPAIDHVWGEKEYYKVPKYDNMYFHLIERGDTMRVDPRPMIPWTWRSCITTLLWHVTRSSD